MTQKEALDILKLGHNVYLTGAAGSGKTFLLNKYIAYLRSKRVEVGITASTGIAATHMNGITIQSWSGIGLRERLTQEDIDELKQKLFLKIRYLGTKVLIIDEVSMLHAHRLDMVDRLCKAFRNNNLPFGGMQVILCGDFFQLPPVTKEKRDTSSDLIPSSFAWNHMNLKICYLHEQYRQADQSFLKILHAIRRNAVTDSELQLLITTMGQPIANGLRPTKLYTHNVDVDEINNLELEKIRHEAKIYTMETKGHERLVQTLKQSCLAPETLVLKKDAQVMFVKNNFAQGYVNGTIGRIVGFSKEKYPIVETMDKKKITVSPASWNITENNMVKASVTQLPLRLAWAITVHKSQGMSLDAAEIDLSKSFVQGMGYVALSRVKSLKGVRLLGLNDLALQVDPKVIELDKQLMQLSDQAVGELHQMNWLKKVRLQREFLSSLTHL